MGSAPEGSGRPTSTRLGSSRRDARHHAMAKAMAALPEHPALIARPKKLATGAEKEEVKGGGGDFG